MKPPSHRIPPVAIVAALIVIGITMALATNTGIFHIPNPLRPAQAPIQLTIEEKHGVLSALSGSSTPDSSQKTLNSDKKVDVVESLSQTTSSKGTAPSPESTMTAEQKSAALRSLRAK